MRTKHRPAVPRRSARRAWLVPVATVAAVALVAGFLRYKKRAAPPPPTQHTGHKTVPVGALAAPRRTPSPTASAPPTAAGRPLPGQVEEGPADPGAFYLSSVNAVNAALADFNGVSEDDSVDLAALQAATTKYVAAVATFANQLATFADWPEPVRPLIDNLVTELTQEQEAYQRAASATTIAEYDEHAAAAANDEPGVAAALRAELGLPERPGQ